MDFQEAINVLSEHMSRLEREEREKGPDCDRQQLIDALDVAIDCIGFRV